jgi:two-component sensor histidine kinase
MWSEGHGVLKDHTSWSTRTHLLLLGLAIATPLLLLLAALLLQSASSQRKELEQRLLQVLDTLVNVLDRDLDRDITILQTLATSQALAREDWPAFYEQAKAGLQGRAYLVLVDSGGRQLVNTYVPYGEQPAMSGDPETVHRIAQTGAPVVSNLFTSLVVKQPVFNVSIPLMRDGQLRFIMSLGLLPRDLVVLLASQKLPPEWVTTIWDANGTILARSRDNDRYLGKALPDNMREQNGQAVSRTKNLDNADVLHAAARSRISGWGVGVNVPYSLITAQVRSSLLLWGATAVLAMAIASGLGLLLARRITASLAAASQAAGAIGRREKFAIPATHLREADVFLATLERARQDVSKAEEHQKFLLRELQHRTQNLFAVVQSIAVRSLVEGQTLDQTKAVIAGRLRALARTHAILAGAAWEGAPLAEILRREFEDGFADCVDIGGCDVVVNEKAAHQFALIFHELATNAIKYGALSAPQGRISIVGGVEQASGAPRFALLWSERGGPPAAQPARKGFGSVVLLDAAKQFGMQVGITYDPQGLIYRLDVPLQDIVPGAAARGETAEAAA